MCPLALKGQVAIHPGFVVSGTAIAAAVMPAMAVIVVMVAYDCL